MKRMVSYRMNFGSKWMGFSAFFAGLAFFLCVVYYYVLSHVENVAGAEFVFRIVWPLSVLGVLMLLIRLVKIDLPVLYACVAGLYFVGVIAVSLPMEPGWLNIVEIIWYVLCLALMIVSALGYFPGMWYAAAAILLAVILRFVLRDFVGSFDILKSMPEAAVLSGLISTGCVCFATKATKPKHR